MPSKGHEPDSPPNKPAPSHPKPARKPKPEEKKPAHSLSRVIALMNQKGGVGKTTTTVNLAAAIAALGRTTLLIDLDPQAHATLHLGVNPAERPLTLYDLLLDPEIDPLDALLCVRPNLGLLPASTDLAAAETELAGESDRQTRLARAVEPLKPLYEFILIDCPPSLGLLTINALALAVEVIVPMQPQFLALQGLGKLLETVMLVGRGVNPRIRVSGVTLCMHEEMTRHAREVLADLEAFFAEGGDQETPWKGARVYRPTIRRNIKLAECPSFGQTIFEYAPGCPGALDYQGLAQTIVAEWDQMLARRTPPAPPTPASRSPKVTVRPSNPTPSASTATPGAAS